ncbi:MAG TPA: NADH-dependent [FeFe] hydrogenase, group A6 [Candidatus Hydrogenedentes bacterium]|nr:NADH-dependent [FeFe] hydrogenase, group A6 [Candidatus Hydrogenedentota bacterium]
MLNIEINGKPFEAKEGETILEAVRRAGVAVPTLCYLEGLAPTGACRICVVEVEGMPNLIPSCSYPVGNNMKIHTHSARAVRARKTIVELLLADHPDDCLYCVRNQKCDLQTLAADLGVRDQRYGGEKSTWKEDLSSPSILRDPNKCILCGKCVRVCEEIQKVAAIDFIGRGSRTHIGTAFDEGLNVSSCINCGQCILACPTGALRERTYIKEVVAALSNPNLVPVVSHAPAISVTLGEEFGLPAGTDVDGVMVAALRALGFKYVFDTSFTADLTIMEEGSELVHRVSNNGKLPMLTSCSPGWIKFVEEFYPDFIPNVSTCKSPQQMMGAIIKSFFAERMKLDPKQIYSVSIMPCTAKKFEASRPEMMNNDVPDIDAVLTTRELAQLFRMRGMDLKNFQPEAADTPFGERTTAGKIFGASGGVMEAAIRSAYFLITKKELGDLNVEAVRGLEGRKEARVNIDGLDVGVAVVSGLGNAAKLLDEIRAGRNDLHFIEVMTCPGGCIAGGGQPLETDKAAIRERMKGLYKLDAEGPKRTSHSNEYVQRLYEEFLVKPLGEKSHHLLHTHYAKREVML